MVHLGPFGSENAVGGIDDACIKAGYLKGISTNRSFVVKVATGGFAGNKAEGLPTADGMMAIFSTRTGMLEGILLDGGHLTDVRTAAVGALAAMHLAPKAVRAIGIVGTGIQARLQLRLLVDLNVVACRDVVLWGRNQENAEACAADMRQESGVKVTVVPTVAEVARACNFIITTTSSTKPLLHAADVLPGTHITAMGSDGVGKQELDAAILRKAGVVVADAKVQCVAYGECHFAVESGGISEGDVMEFGTFLERHTPTWKQREDDRISVFDSTGVAIADSTVAGLMVKALVQEQSAADGHSRI